jgi:nicotinamidase-related amidase
LKLAIVVVDMLVDNLKTGKHAAIKKEGLAIVPALGDLLGRCREVGVPVIYANDSFLSGDALFRSRLQPHSLRGTPGAMVVPELAPEPCDLILPKRRFSAFYKTDLDQTLRTLGVDTLAVAGITTTFCVLTTALDAVQHDFRAVILEDVCAAPIREAHRSCLDLYRESVLWPLLRVEGSDALWRAWETGTW